MIAPSGVAPVSLPRVNPESKASPQSGLEVFRFRGDIQGLRAVAVLGVLLFHIEPTWLPGGFAGVDIFFVISGYLITSLLIKEVARTGTISLGSFYARRVRRILPAASATLIATLLASALLLPTSQVWDLASTAAFSAIGLANWALARETSDYFASGNDASPLQHFWSLAVEEQYYVVWPFFLALLLIAAGLWKARRRSVTALGVATVVLAASAMVFFPSFIHSVLYTASDPGPAYFITTTRAWELAVGAGLSAAVVLARRPLGVRLSRVLALVGGVMIVAAYVFYSGDTPFPSWTAMLPVLGAALVILGGTFDRGRSVLGLDRGPMVWLGDLSYSLYLVHWPMLALFATAVPGASVWAHLGVGILSMPVAVVLRKVVEIPVQTAGKMAPVRPTLAAGLATVVVTLLVALGVGAYSQSVIDRDEARAAQAASTVQGAAATRDGNTVVDPMDSLDDVDMIVPAPSSAEEDKSPVNLDDCQAVPKATVVKECSYGDEGSDVLIVLVGDSHASHWSSALVPMAEERGWHLVTMTKARCPMVEGTPVLNEGGEPIVSDECEEWNASARARVAELDPTMVITASSVYDMAGGETFADALATTWQGILDEGIPLTVMIDTPRSSHHLAVCVESNRDDLANCATDADIAEQSSAAPSQREALAQVSGVSSIDLNSYICPGEKCSPVVGGVLVYFDSGHMTNTFTRTLIEPLEAELVPLVEAAQN